MTGSFRDNVTQSRYEYQVDNHIAVAMYRKENNVLYIDYVEAPEALRGTGAAGRLMEYVVTTAQAENLRIVPICGYAASWLKRHKTD
jgi:predicted GNAT family acetyltransferase